MMTDVGADVGSRTICSLLLGMQSGATTVKIIVKLPQKAKNVSIIRSNYTSLEHIPRGFQNLL